MDVWVAGRIFNQGRDEPKRHEILGVYDSREKAVARCNGWGIAEKEWGDWIARLELNVGLPDEPCAWPEFYWVNSGRLYDRDGKPLEGA